MSVDFYKNQIKIAENAHKKELPQTNFEEVKAATEFFDSICEPIKNNQSSMVESPFDLRYLHAKAHYFYAVGLNERGDFVAACRKYFKVLEMLELNYRSNDIDDDYKKIILSTYINLGHLYRDEANPRIAINMYKNAIPYIDFLGNDNFKAQTYKFIGMTYMFVDNDSSLYYFDKCVETNPANYLNKIDVDKCRATIYFDSGDKGKAFSIMKDNLEIIEHEHVRESYYALLGDMYYNDKQYDSAICYLDRTFESKNFL